MNNRHKLTSSFFPLNRNDVPSTTADDILNLAACLQNSTEVVKILKRRGVSQLLPEAEEIVVNEALLHCAGELGTMNFHWDNAAITVCLLRRHVNGSLVLADREKASDFVNARLRNFRFDDDETRPDVRMKLSEMLEIYLAFSENFPETLALMDEIHAAVDKSPYHDERDSNANWTISTATALSLSIGVKLLGYANRSRRDIEQLVSVFIEYSFRNHPKILSEESILDCLREQAYMKRYKFRDTQNIDEALPRYIDDLTTKYGVETK